MRKIFVFFVVGKYIYITLDIFSPLCIFKINKHLQSKNNMNTILSILLLQKYKLFIPRTIIKEIKFKIQFTLKRETIPD